MIERKTELKELTLDQIKPNPRNVKNHPDYQVESIAKSILRFGFIDPIEVDASYEIINGHGRYLAIQLLLSQGKWDKQTLPCLVHDIHNQARAKAYGIAHNQITLSSSFDYQKINDDMGLQNIERSDMLDAGFDTDSLKLLDPQPEQRIFKEVADDQSKWAEHVLSAPKVSLLFSSQEQQDKWFRFLAYLDRKYPDLGSVADRLSAFISAETESYGDV